ncbi:MAG: hypothetical protein IPI41_12770 [Flavobacteriales bacterium]|nr:hypothetical protein [Flavobacteriales bacterium]
MLQEYLQGTQGDSLRIDLREENIYHEVSYNLDHRSGLMPSSVKLDLQHHNAFTRLALDARQAFVYARKHHRVSVRLFAGQFLRRDEALMRNPMAWGLTLGSIGHDVRSLLHGAAGCRTHHGLSNGQGPGAPSRPNSQGYCETWIDLLNLEADVPFGLPLMLFASAGAAPYAQVTATGAKNFGVCITKWVSASASSATSPKFGCRSRFPRRSGTSLN